MHCCLRSNCTERYEIVVLLPNSKHTKGNNMKYQQHDTDVSQVVQQNLTMADMRYDFATLNFPYFFVCGQKH